MIPGLKHGKASARGIVICGGGYPYFANSWVLLCLLRKHGVKLPVELWLAAEENSKDMERWLSPYHVTIRIFTAGNRNASLPAGARWQWVIKPWALLHTAFREALFFHDWFSRERYLCRSGDLDRFYELRIDLSVRDTEQTLAVFQRRR